MTRLPFLQRLRCHMLLILLAIGTGIALATIDTIASIVTSTSADPADATVSASILATAVLADLLRRRVRNRIGWILRRWRCRQ